MTRSRRGVSLTNLLVGLISFILLSGLGITGAPASPSAPVDSWAADGASESTADAPAITGMTGPTQDSTYADGEVLSFSITYDQTVEVSGTPSIELNVDGTTRSADYVSGSGSQTLTFEYTVQSGEDDADGIGFETTNTQGTIEDTDGNAAASDFSTEAPDLTGVLVDGVVPASLSVDDPTSEVLRASTATNDGNTTLDVTYSYEDATPDTTTITFTDGSNSATFGIDDSGYAGDGTQKTVTLDLTSPDEESGGLLDGTTYDLDLTTTDQAAHSETASESGVLTIDNTAPPIQSISLSNNGMDELELSFVTEEQLAGADAAINVEVEGPGSGSNWMSFDGSDFSETNTNGTFTYELTTMQAYDDGSGTYTATLTTAEDAAGNNGADGTDTDDYFFNLPPDAVADRDTTTEDNNASRSAPGLLSNDSDPNDDPFSISSVEGDGSNVGSEFSLSSGALLTVQSDGQYSYDPNGQFDSLAPEDTTTDSFAYTIEDDPGDTDQTTVTLAIAGVNDAPTVQDDSYSTTEDDMLSESAPGVIDNDDDPEGDALTISSVAGGDNVGSQITLDSGATLTMDADGSFDYSPTQSQIDTLADDESITDSFTYTATDGNKESQAAVTVTVTGVNDAPIVETNDVLAVSSSGGTETITTEELNASDPDTDAPNLTFTVTSAPSSGTLIVDGTSGAGSFTQQQILDGAVEYEHDGSSVTTDEFDFELTDADGAGPAPATFEIVIGLDNTDPTATNDDSTTTEDEVLAVPDSINGVLGNDSDPDGDPLVVSEVDGVSGNVGTEIELTSGSLLTIDEDGTYTYDPNGKFEDLGDDESNSESVSYTIADGKGGTATATFTVTIDGVNDAPTLDTNDRLEVESGEAETITVQNLSASDPDDDRSAITFTITEPPSNGTLLLGSTALGAGESFTQQDLVDGAVAYENSEGTTAEDQFSFDLSDGTDPGPQGQTFEIFLSNSPPSASADSYSTPEDETLVVSDSTNGVLGNDSDPDGDPLSASISSTPQHGSLTLNDDGTFEYAPEADYNGSDSFIYQVSDGNGESDQASVDLTISAVNDTPQVSVNDGLTVSQTGESTITTSELSATDVEDDADALTFTVTDGPTQGTLLVNGQSSSQFTQQTLADGDVSYNHTAETTDDDQFVFDLTDSEGAGPSGREFTITVQGGNLPPTARDTSLVADEDSVASGGAPGVLGNDSDPDGDTLSVSAVEGGGGGSVGSEITLDSGALLTLNGNGSYAFDPNDQFEALEEGETESVSFTYEAADGNGGTDQATVSVTIEGRNELPSVTLDTPSPGSVVQEGQEVTLTASASDEDGSISEVAFRAENTTIGTDDDGSDGFQTTWTPDNPGRVSLVAEATDDAGATVRSSSVQIRVRAAQTDISPTRRFPNPTEKSGFRLVALPGQVDRSLQSTLSERSDDDWRAFRETGGTGSSTFGREQCTDANCTLRPGNGFWLIAREGWTADYSLETVPLQPGSAESPSTYSVPIHDGWNVVSNPLMVDVSWSDVQEASGTSQNLWRWNGTWEQVTTFTSAAEGEAFYFRDDQIDSLVVPYPSSSTASTLARSSSAPSEETEVQPTAELSLSIVSAEDTVSTVRAGIHPTSEVGFDSADRYGPPGYFGPATLRLVESQDERPHVLSADRKPPRREGYAYNVRLRSVPDTALNVLVRGTNDFSQEQISLVRRSTNREYDLHSDSTITVVPETETTRFRLLVGSDAFVDEARENITPDEAKLLPNYPEPFRKTTRIQYSLPERQQVRLVVYDLLGRRVDVLKDAVQSAGFHQIQWPKSGAGPSLASGTYFVRLDTETTTKTERLVVIR